MKRIFLLIFLIMNAIPNVNTWPDHFKNLWCPGQDQVIDKQKLLNHPNNKFWKKQSETAEQEEKDEYLKNALTLPGGDPLCHKRRQAIACALVAGGSPDVETADHTVLSYACLHDDYYLAKFVLQSGANPKKNIPKYGTPLCLVKTIKMVQLLVEHKVLM